MKDREGLDAELQIQRAKSIFSQKSSIQMAKIKQKSNKLCNSVKHVINAKTVA